MTDAALAIVHHLLAFGLAILLALQLAVVRPGLAAGDLRRLGAIDAGYGATAGLLIAVGVLRVFYGAKGAAYYGDNPWFWAKMAAFAAVGLLSIAPTLAFRRWRSAAPGGDAVAGVRRLLRLEAGLLLLIPVFAALMARYQG